MKTLQKILIITAVSIIAGCTSPVATDTVDITVTGQFIRWVGFIDHANVIVTVDGDTVFGQPENQKRIESIVKIEDGYALPPLSVNVGAEVIATAWFNGEDTLTASMIAVHDSYLQVVK